MNEAAVNHADEGGYHDKCSFPLRNGDAFFSKVRQVSGNQGIVSRGTVLQPEEWN